MTSAPLLSVVLPVFNPDSVFFPVAVRSILNQTMPDLEVLVIEDPSSVSAADCLKGIEDERLVLHRNSERTSMVSQLNRGLELARAPWIARMDGGDEALPERFERQLAELERTPAIDVLGTQIDVVDEHGKPAGARSFPTGHDSICRALRRYNPISHPTVVMRRSTILKAGGYRYPERAAQDYELWCRLAVSGARFANLEETLLRYRLHSGSIKSKRAKATLQATTAAKREQLWHQLSFADRILYGLERTAEFLPEAVIRTIAQWQRYRR